ncbi:MAG: flagellar basal-body MS-ring/collar protein FliF [Nitrospiria bacterium]
MNELLERLRTNLSEMSMGKKIALAATFAGGLAMLAVIWLWSQEPDFRVLYTNLNSEDAAVVISKFKEMNVPYEFSDDGKSLRVPAERVHELRLLLASEGLPQGGGVGFEIFDQSSFGTTEFAQKLNYKRALQGELARTITQLEEISNARVHLVIPEPSLFTDQEELTRAAVVINLKPGKQLNQTQIQGITHLVSGSVEGLAPEAVTIVDNRGKIRTTGSEGSTAMQMSGSQLDFQKNLEQKIQQKIHSMLAQVVGPDKALVRVSATLDLRQVELTEEKFDPDTQVVRSQQRSQGNSSGSSNTPAPGGIPGVASNVPPSGEQTGGGARNQNTSNNLNEVINYEISKTVSRVVEPFGTIKRLSVAALIDGTYEEVTNEEGVTSQEYIPRGEEEMATLDAIVKKAMGFSAERRDEVEVVNIPFKGGKELDANEVAETSLLDKIMQWLPVVRQILAPLLIVLILMAIVRPLMKVVTAPLPQPVLLPEPALAEGGGTEGGLGEALEGGETPQQIEAPEKPVSTQEQILKLAEKHPDAAALLIKRWIRQG